MDFLAYTGGKYWDEDLGLKVKKEEPSTPTLVHIKVESPPTLNVGNVSGVLRGEMPRIARAEDKSESKQAWELIYKRRSTLKGNNPPKPWPGPLALLSLDTPSLTSPCYMSPLLKCDRPSRILRRKPLQGRHGNCSPNPGAPQEGPNSCLTRRMAPQWH